jgi:galactose-1-phosphate uridylyltransferase
MHNLKPEAKYFLFFWNCLKRAGATQAHGHCQVLLTSGKHYSKIEQLRKSALEYQKCCNSNYFDDLFEVHQALGYAIENEKVRILSYLTPLKYDEVIILSDTLKPGFKTAIFDMLALFRDELKTTSFNLGLITPPLGETQESWEGFPCIGHIVDRGGYDDHTSDFGGFELFGATMVLRDPFRLATKIRNHFQGD